MTRPGLACLVATLVSLPGAADDDARRHALEQKAALVQRVLEDPALSARIAAAAGGEARALVDRADEARRRGLTLVAAGRMAEGESALDEAIAMLARARRLAPDPAQRKTDLRERYAARDASTGALLASARRHAAPGASEALARGADQMARARQLAQAERLEDALSSLDAAERSLLDALSVALAGRTLDYTPRFDAPEDAWHHELARHGSFRALVPVALEQLSPPPSQRRLVDESVREAVRLHDFGVARMRAGDLAGALVALRQSTEWLQRALTAAGLVVPAADARNPHF